MALTKIGKEGVTGISNSSDATAITIDSSEKVGIGETSPLGTLHVRTSDASITSVNANADDFIVENNGNCGISICSSTSGQGNINFIDSGDTNIGRINYSHDTNNMIFRANDSEALRIDSSQSLLGPPSANFNIKTGSGTGDMLFSTNGSERMRIDSNGNVGINVSSGGARLHVEDDTNDQIGFFLNTNSGMTSNTLQVSTARNTTNSSYNHFACAINGIAAKFMVRDSGNAVNTNNSYGAISDQRMKENIADAASLWDDIKALQVRKYNRLGETQKELGVIAQELEASGMGGLVEEGSCYDVDNNPNEETRKSVKYSVLYMKAVKALQEAMTRIETLETEMTALKARVTSLEDA
tara:strand:+ start:61 stop:1125 length:1065 start_codon:yes stop_codon:yes gene_type:complete